MLSFLFAVANLAAASLNPSLIGGDVVDQKLWPELIYIETDYGGYCSAVIVGPQTLLTAAHCVPRDGITVSNVYPGDHTFTAVCDIPKEYGDSDHSFDVAVCKRKRGKFKLKPASVANEELEEGATATLAGYGCTSSDGLGNNNGTLKVGKAKVTWTPSDVDTFFLTEGTSVLCFGDSGGPVYGDIDPEHDKHVVYGINSRTDLKTLSVLTSVYSDSVRLYLKRWAKRHRTVICGINKKC